MERDIIKSQLKIYEEQFAKFGDSPDGTFNQNTSIQNLRFERLLKQFDFEASPYSLHDVGCGICDLYTYINQNKLNIQYSGTDIVPEMKVLAQKKYPNIDVQIKDILNEELKEEYDIVVLAGTFNLPSGVDKESWKLFTRSMIKAMFSLCKVGISFNFLSTHAEFENEAMYYESPNEIIDFCVQELSRFVVIDHSYPLFEQTITVFKPSYMKNKYSNMDLLRFMK
jgi:hypothetical protein